MQSKRCPAWLKTFELGANAVIEDRHQEELEQLGEHDASLQHGAWDDERHRYAQELLREQRTSFERQIWQQQLAVAREANELARSCSYAASDAAAAARSHAHIARAALIIATIALLVSVVTPQKIAVYVSSKP